jgi:hypothetical protein
MDGTQLHRVGNNSNELEVEWGSRELETWWALPNSIGSRWPDRVKWRAGYVVLFWAVYVLTRSSHAWTRSSWCLARSLSFVFPRGWSYIVATTSCIDYTLVMTTSQGTNWSCWCCNVPIMLCMDYIVVVTCYWFVISLYGASIVINELVYEPICWYVMVLYF